MAIQIRRGTDAEWESNNSNIVAGEPAVTLDTGRFFVGTGNGEFVELQKKGNGGDGLTEDVKQALLQIASKVAYIDERGQDYYDALEAALYPDASLVSISAVYTQIGTVYDTDSLDSLKADLVVTAHFDDSSTEVVTAYTLSGTLTVGTSTITVSYGGKTTTFDVTVTHVMTLDDIAYGNLTYRDIFITNNMIKYGDFETEMTIDSNWHAADTNIWQYKKNAGNPVQTTESSASPSHSLKCFGSGSSQIAYSNNTTTFNAGSYLACIAVRVDRYVSGNAGWQIGAPINNAVERITFGKQEVTDGFVPCVEILTLAANRLGMFTYIGTMTSADCDAYVDDAVLTPLPTGLTKADALVLYSNYLSIRRSAS